MKKLTLFIFLFFSSFVYVYAKEGMWIPLLLEKYNLIQMQQMGFELEAKDIYSTDGSGSMKDAVVIFGGGCTGELISGEGLIITNHHCGYRQIQAHSTIEHDYLTNGFWAKNRKEELPNPGLTVKFLEYMQDVTDLVLNGIDNLDYNEKKNIIDRNKINIIKKANENGKYSAQVKPLFYGNKYYLYVYKVYRDVRLVGAPPSAIGKFGGDTDNWMWPRHTGDFSLFRIYADKNNQPADYSADNVPFKPKKFFPISVKGINSGDFAMVFGNPGSTSQYIPSQEVDIILNQRNPNRIAVRDKKLEIIGAAMKSDPAIRIQYSAKYASLSNSWKRWQGEIMGLKKNEAVRVKQEFENEFKLWAIDNMCWDNEYERIFNDFDSLYVLYKNYINITDYYLETVWNGVEIFRLAQQVMDIIVDVDQNKDKLVDYRLKRLKEYLPNFSKDFNQPTDEKLFTVLMSVLYNNLNKKYLPNDFVELIQKNSDEKLIKKVYQKSILTNMELLSEVLCSKDKKRIIKLKRDPLINLYAHFYRIYRNDISPNVENIVKQIEKNMKIYMAGIIKMKEGKALYPDANFTLRVAYGKVEGYEPRDGLMCKYYTTLEGIMEKDNPMVYDYNVPDRLRNLFINKDYGDYSVDGKLPVCFTSSIHTTGGNSGSPVVNGNGQLIGINFDRCWEGTMSDIMYDPKVCRNIAIDIRYALFLIDKFAGAGYLLDEMELVNGSEGVEKKQGE